MEATRAHYDKQANHPSKAPRAVLRDRAAGRLAPLKKFHNTIKRKLLQRFAHKAPRLLDLACGRGGDIPKWMDCGIGYAKGLDLSPAQIAEAERRYAWLSNPNGSGTVCDFETTCILGKKLWIDDDPYDVVTCMFAAQYFCESEQTLRTFLETVAANLKPGGYFLGCAPSAMRVISARSSDLLSLEVFGNDEFGAKVRLDIHDTVTAGGNKEFLLWPDTFLRIAKEAGLDPVMAFGSDLDSWVHAESYFKYFLPIYDNDPDLTSISRLFGAFAFTKRDCVRIVHSKLDTPLSFSSQLNGVI